MPYKKNKNKINLHGATQDTFIKKNLCNYEKKLFTTIKKKLLGPYWDTFIKKNCFANKKNCRHKYKIFLFVTITFICNYL